MKKGNLGEMEEYLSMVLAASIMLHDATGHVLSKVS